MNTQTALVIVTFILALITFFYLLETRKMAKAMTEELKIRITPRINIELHRRPGGGLENSVSLIITNKGSYHVKLRKEQIYYFIGNNNDDLFHSDKEEAINNWISPDDKIKRGFDYNFINKGKEIQRCTESNIRLAIKIVFEFENVMGDKYIESYIDIIGLGEKKELLRNIRNKDKNFFTTRDSRR